MIMKVYDDSDEFIFFRIPNSYFLLYSNIKWKKKQCKTYVLTPKLDPLTKLTKLTRITKITGINNSGQTLLVTRLTSLTNIYFTISLTKYSKRVSLTRTKPFTIERLPKRADTSLFLAVYCNTAMSKLKILYTVYSPLNPIHQKKWIPLKRMIRLGWQPRPIHPRIRPICL